MLDSASSTPGGYPRSLTTFIRRLGIGCIAWPLLVGCESKPIASEPMASAGGSEGGEAVGGAPNAEPQTLRVLDAATISSNPDDENFQQVSGQVDFGEVPVSSAVLRIELDSPCFPFSRWLEQGVPEGQRWPARCDAFDRGLSVTLDDEGAERSEPAIELVRAVTPFGGPFELEVDITDVVNGLPGPHRMRLGIDTWSDAEGLVSGSAGEWIGSIEVVLTPGEPPRRVLAVTPLVLGLQTTVEAEPIELVVPDDVGSARIDYRVTGHGGVGDPQCLGPAEEFCRRRHELRLDGELLAELSPWRSDCDLLCTVVENDVAAGPASYCSENPCGDPRSVRASRANWCPGSATPPFALSSPLLTTAGSHELTRTVEGLREGGQWHVSATYFAFAAAE